MRRSALAALITLTCFGFLAAREVVANHVAAPYWTHPVQRVGGGTQLDASFWGFASVSSLDGLNGPFDQGRQDQLDPINTVFYTTDGSSALGRMYAVLTAGGWTTQNPCTFFDVPLETDLYAYFEDSPFGEIERASFFKPVEGCAEKYHVRLWAPTFDSTWGIAATHHECNLLDFTACPAVGGDLVIGWDDAEAELAYDVVTQAHPVSFWRANLGNTASAGDCPGGGWRNNLGQDVCNDGIAWVFELATSPISPDQPPAPPSPPPPPPVDSQPPTVTIDVSCPQGISGWCVGPPLATVHAVDDQSGVAVVQCRVNGGGWQAVAGPLSFGEGIFDLDCRASDNSGNVSQVVSATIRADLTPPVTRAFVVGARDSLGVFRSKVKLELIAQDNLSGVGSTVISFDNGATWQSYSEAIVLSENKVYSCLYKSTDIAGNVEQARRCGEFEIQLRSITTKLLKSDRAGSVNVFGIIQVNGDVSLTRNTLVSLETLNYTGGFTQSANTTMSIQHLNRVATPVVIPDYGLRWYRENCQLVVGNLVITSTAPVFDGCYYVTGDATVLSTSPSGRLTIVAEGTIYDRTTTASLAAWDSRNGILYYGVKGYVSTATTPTYNGIVYSPNATISGTPTNFTLTGGLIASTVSLSMGTSVNVQQGPGFSDATRYELPLDRTTVFTSLGAEDGYLVESGETTGVGGSKSNVDTTLRVGDDASNRQVDSVVSFDTSSLPDNAVITSAELHVRRSGVTGTSPFSTHGLLGADIVSGWYSTSSALEVLDFQAASTVEWAVPLTRAVNNGDWTFGLLNSPGATAINRTGRTQLRLHFALDDNNNRKADYVSLSSGDDASVASRPVLSITYTIP